MVVKASLLKACQELDAQIQELDRLGQPQQCAPPAPNLFETEPVPPLTTVPVEQPWQQETTTSIVLEATAPTMLDPELEQATLEELNSALSKAFAQISGRQQWAG